MGCAGVRAEVKVALRVSLKVSLAVERVGVHLFVWREKQQEEMRVLQQEVSALDLDFLISHSLDLDFLFVGS